MFCRYACAIFILSFAVLAGCGSSPQSAPATQPAAGSPIRITADVKGFTPSEVTIPADTPVTLEFVRAGDSNCADAVVFSASGERHKLPVDQPVQIQVQAKAGETVAFACPMNMYKGFYQGK